jgi:hypothetical protein
METHKLKFINNNLYNCEVEFFGTDTKTLFHQNNLLQPNDWHYRSQTITYNFNKQGFRSYLDYDNIDWANTVVLLGCSNIMGVGLSFNETLDYHIQSQTGYNVVNLGVAGSSIDVSIYNSAVVKNITKHVKAVIVGWPSAERFLTFTEDTRQPIHNTPANLTSNDLTYFDKFLSGQSMHTRYKNLLFKELYSNFCKIYEFTFSEHTNDILGCDFYRVEDFARDIQNNISHPGKHTISKVSSDIVNFLLDRPYVPNGYKISRFI